MKVPAGTVVLSRYKVVKLLGEGGYGAVYLAHDIRLGDKRVALKQSFDNSRESQEQFRLEAQLLAALDHPNLPRVTDHFSDQGGSLFLVMDFIEGEDLVERCAVVRRCPAPAQEAAQLMLQICEAVAYLHAHRPNPIIHRDIKPSNIKICPSGKAVLVDFGIAKLYQPTKGTVRVAKAISPPFSPPEQYGGKTDQRSDVYSLGATLYVLLCMSELPDAMDRSTQSKPTPSPRQTNPNVPPDLDAIVMRAIDLDPLRRFSSAGEMAAALRAFILGQPVHASVPASPQPGIACPRCGWNNRPTARFCVRDGAPLSAAPATSIPPEARFEIANEYANRKQYDQAIHEYQFCLRDQFAHAAVYHNLGLCYRLANHCQESRYALTRGVALYPTDPDLRLQLALTYRELKDMDSAADSIMFASHLNPADETTGSVLGIILIEAGRIMDAISQLDQITRLKPDSAVLLYQLGRAYFFHDEFDKAIQKLKRAIQHNARMAEAHFFLGGAYLQKKKFDDAIRSFQEAISQEPSSGLAYFFLGKALMGLNRFKEALPAFAKAGQLLVDDPDPYVGLAMCYRSLSQPREAISAVEQALAIRPGYKAALDLRARLTS